jgi:hypothetical protein
MRWLVGEIFFMDGGRGSEVLPLLPLLALFGSALWWWILGVCGTNVGNFAGERRCFFSAKGPQQGDSE